jgi:mRNA interferase HigB
MRIISRRILREFWIKHPDAKTTLQTWFHDVEQANWNSPTDIKKCTGMPALLQTTGSFSI